MAESMDGLNGVLIYSVVGLYCGWMLDCITMEG